MKSRSLFVGLAALVSVAATDHQTLRQLVMGQSALDGRRLANQVKLPPISNDTMAQARNASVGFQTFLTNLRGGGSASYYQNLFTAFQIGLCQASVDSDAHQKSAEPAAVWTGLEEKLLPYFRFVSPSSKFAYKNSSGDCIQVLAPPAPVVAQYGAGFCEVKPNCYWTAIDTTALTDRIPVYSVNQAMQPPTGSMTLVTATTKLTEWGQGFGACVIPSIILLVLSVLTILLFIICRCCCNKCGGRSAKPGGYSCLEKFLPILFYLLFSIAILVLAGLSYLYSTVITQAVSNIFIIVLNLIETIVGWISSVLTPLQHIATTVESSASTIGKQLSDSVFIDNGLHGILAQMDAFAAQTANVMLPMGCTTPGVDFCTKCDACTNINTEVKTAKDQMNAAAGPGLDTLKTTRTNVLSLLVDASANIASFVSSVTTTSTNLNTQIDDKKSLVKAIQEAWDSNGVVTQGAFMALFALAIVTIVIGLLGVLFGLTPLRVLVIIMHLAYVIGFFAIIITFLLSIVFIVFSLLLSDLCKLQEIATKDWTKALGDEASVLNACFQNGSLIDAFNLSSSFAFATDITFPSLDLGAMLDFSSFNSFSSSISSTTTSTFNFDSSGIATYLGLLNAATAAGQSGGCLAADGTYTTANILKPWDDSPNCAGGGTKAHTAGQTGLDYIKACYPTALDAKCAAAASCKSGTCQYSDFVAEIYKNVSTLQLIKDQSTQFITNMTTSMTSLNTTVTSFKANVTGLSNTLNGINADLQTTLVKDVNTIMDQMYCTFVANTYRDLTDQLCNFMTPSFLMIALFIFLMGVFLIPIIITLIIMVKRLRHKKANIHGDVDTKLK